MTRGEGAVLALGKSEIAVQRTGGMPPRRRVERLHVSQVEDTVAVVTAETVRPDGGTGLQTQVWRRETRGWRIVAAHVGRAPATIAEASDAATGPFRVELEAPPQGDGTLAGMRLAVKDLFAVVGERVGAGVPAWLADAPVETESAPAVAALVAAGAHVVGIAHTDELAFGLGGANEHYGTPLNPCAPEALPGGSSSGSASAVAQGLADLGLGTDTAGSIRVPASYCGLFGFRASTGAVSMERTVGLAPSFDAVGLLARSLDDLRRAAAEMLPVSASDARIERLVIDESLFGGADAGLAASLRGALRAGASRAGIPVDVAASDLADRAFGPWFEAFRAVQAREAWLLREGFLTGHPGGVSPSVEARFHAGAVVSAADEAEARAVLAEARASLDALLGDNGALVLPTCGTVAPTATDAIAVERARTATLPLTAIGSWSGRPVVSLPVGLHRGRPAGLSVIGPAGDDAALLDLCRRFSGGPDPQETTR